MTPLRRPVLAAALAALLAAVACDPPAPNANASSGASPPAAGATPPTAGSVKAAAPSAVAAGKAGAIDPKAAAIYDAAVAAAKKLKSFDAVTSVRMDQATNDAKVDQGQPGRFVVVFGGADDASPVLNFRLEVMKDGKPARVITGGKDNTTVVDLEAKWYQELGPDPSAVADDLMEHYPQWIFTRKGSDAADEPPIVSAALLPEETVDGAACDVVRVTREMTVPVEPDEDAAEGAAAGAAKTQTVRFFETLAIARSDSIPRRIVEDMTIVDQPTKMAPATTSLYAQVKVNFAPDAALFTAKVPDGFAKKDAPKAPDPSKPAELAFKAGDKAPAFSLADNAGGTVTLDSLKGKVVLLDFWATWCGPCRKVMPVIQKLNDEFKDKGVAVFGVNTWEKRGGAADDASRQAAMQTARKYMEDKKYTYGCLFGGDDLAKAYGVPGIPTLVLINKDGTIAMTEVGAGDETESQLRAAIQAALAK
jgi:thiol-disulfide isomerase/thioredoxin